MKSHGGIEGLWYFRDNLNNLRQRMRPIVATLLRKDAVVWSRRYLKLDNAIPRAVQLAMQEGQPRDVIEFSHVDTGMQIGTVKLSVGNKLVSNWVWD